MPIHTSVEDGIGKLVLSYPPLNILSREVMAELRAKLHALEADRTIRVLLLQAEGKHFSAGAAVGEHLPPEHEEMIPEFLDTIALLAAFPLPVIAAVRGRCLGGGFELILAADLVVAGEGAALGTPEIVLGVFPPVACAFLPDLASPGAAAEIVFTGDSLTAQQAHEIGIVRRVVADDKVEQEALALAQRIARHSAAALRANKRALRAGYATRRSEALEAAGRVYLDELMQTADAVEGLRAFTEKRQPVWQHA
jgi:cyclohexa-1,5-dienecarbonyl-CoA hydratase